MPLADLLKMTKIVKSFIVVLKMDVEALPNMSLAVLMEQFGIKKLKPATILTPLEVVVINLRLRNLINQRLL